MQEESDESARHLLTNVHNHSRESCLPPALERVFAWLEEVEGGHTQVSDCCPTNAVSKLMCCMWSHQLCALHPSPQLSRASMVAKVGGVHMCDALEFSVYAPQPIAFAPEATDHDSDQRSIAADSVTLQQKGGAQLRPNIHVLRSDTIIYTVVLISRIHSTTYWRKGKKPTMK